MKNIFCFWACLLMVSISASAPGQAQESKPYIGDMKIIKAKYEDTLLRIMRDNNLGYVEMRAANPDVDIWIPGEGQEIVLPLRHLLPDAPHKGIVINLAEMRLYSYVDDVNNPKSYPIGIGRSGLDTPTGSTKVVRKKDGPSWRPTERMREENPALPEVVPPGEDNPLGTHALYLGWPTYLIHGTLRPWGIGRRVSSGCIRMYPEDIKKVFKDIPVGTRVRVVKQPLKMAWIGDTLYIEAHADEVLADNIERHGRLKKYGVPKSLFRDLRKVAGAHYDDLDWDKVRAVVKERKGYPIAVFNIKDHKKAVAKAKKEKEKAEKTALAALEQKGDEVDREEKARENRRKTVSRRGFN